MKNQEWWKMNVGDNIHTPRRKADLNRNLEYAHDYYVVKREMFPVRFVLGFYGLIVFIIAEFFKEVEHVADVLISMGK